MHILYLMNNEDAPPGLLAQAAARRGAGATALLPILGWSSDPGRSAEVPAHSEGFDGLVLLGGPMHADDEATYPFLGAEKELIRTFADDGKPVLGVCLGAQLVASAFGARVYPLPVEEFGFLPHTFLPAAASDPLLTGVPSGLHLMQWHEDTFDLPDGAVPLATRDGCPNQAFRLGESIYGCQFHLETTAEILRRWIELRVQWKHLPKGPIRQQVEEGIARHYRGQQRFAGQLMERWLDLI